MADIAKLVEDLSKLTVMEAAELAKALEEEWGVSAAAAVAVAAPAGGGAAAEAVEEKTEFDVILTGDGGKKSPAPFDDHSRLTLGEWGPAFACATSARRIPKRSPQVAP